MVRTLALLSCLLLVWGCADPGEPDGFGAGEQPLDDDDTSQDDDDASQDDADGDGYPAASDCDDEDPWVHPNAPELCDGLDNDCDDLVDEEPLANLAWYPDEDGDGFGTEDGTVTGCIGPDGYVAQAGDCDDDNPVIHPGALVDAADADCDGRLEWRVEITLTVVQSYELCVDDEDTILGRSINWENAETYPVWLDSGPHTVGFEGVGVEWDEEESELTAAIVEIAISSGQQWWSNSNWRYDPDPLADADSRVGWCSPGFDAEQWDQARDFGSWGVPPWGNYPPELAGTAASWIWDAVPIEHNTQYFRLDFELP